MKRLKLSYEEVREVNPAIIYVSISGFGQEGPYSSFPAYDPIIQAMGGSTALTGEPDGPPVMSGIGVADWFSGMSATVATLLALLFWKNTGKGQYIDLSMQDCVWLMAAQTHASAYFAKGEVPTKTGNYMPPFAPYNCYKAKDGYIVIAAITNVQWQGLLKAMGREDLLQDPHLSHLKGRGKKVAEIDQMIQAWVEEKTIREIQDKLVEERVPSGPVLTFDKLIADPNLLARQMITDIEQPGVGKMKIPGSVFKLSESAVEFKLPAPSLGEHNAEIYSQVLGLGQEDLASLKEEEII
jgi:crotonobetainyl-CoA:carnitine CoA-transferase CaiB-like acyl-CoA transferase